MLHKVLELYPKRNKKQKTDVIIAYLENKLERAKLKAADLSGSCYNNQSES